MSARAWAWWLMVSGPMFPLACPKSDFRMIQGAIAAGCGGLFIGFCDLVNVLSM